MFRRADEFNKLVVNKTANQLQGDAETTKDNRKHA